jgi:hypothetical protein
MVTLCTTSLTFSNSTFCPPPTHTHTHTHTHTPLYLCVLCGSQNKQRLFPYTALTDWFLQPGRKVFTARYEPNLYKIQANLSILCPPPPVLFASSSPRLSLSLYWEFGMRLHNSNSPPLNVLPCFQATFTRKTYGHCLETFKTVNILFIPCNNKNNNNIIRCRRQQFLVHAVQSDILAERWRRSAWSVRLGIPLW